MRDGDSAEGDGERSDRVKRWLFNRFGVVSLALWLAMTAMLVDGKLLHNVRKLYDQPIRTRTGGIDGRKTIAYGYDTVQVLRGMGPWWSSNGTRIDVYSVPGLTLMHLSGRDEGLFLEMSLWFGPSLLLPLITGWAFLFVKRQRHTRRLVGHCPTCGYNLTGNESGVCPECGTAIHTRATDLEPK